MSAVALAIPRTTRWPSPARAYDPAEMSARALSPHSEGMQIVAARHGDPAAFEALVRRHQGAIYNFCLRMLGQAEDAADVAQDTFVQLYSHLGRLDEREPLAAWLFRVARNRCIDVIRRRRTISFEHAAEADDPADGALTLEPVDDEPLPDELAERSDLQHLLATAISHLPPAYAEVVALRYAGDRSFAEIGVILECDEGAARVRFHRAKALLRQQLRDL